MEDYVIVPQDEEEVEETAASDFVVKSAQIEPIVEVLRDDPVLLQSWGNILHHFVSNPADTARLTKLLTDGQYEEAIRGSLQCWLSEKGADATFQACIRILVTRKCRAVADKLLDRAKVIQKVHVPVPGAVNKDDEHEPPPAIITCTLSGPGKTVIAVALVLIVLAGALTGLLFWKPWVGKDELGRPLPSKQVPAGEPGKRRWGSIPDCTAREELILLYTSLGYYPDSFVHALQKCPTLRRLYMILIDWDGRFTEKAQLQLLDEYQLSFSAQRSSSRPPLCTDKMEPYVNSLIIFFKDGRQKSLDQSYSLNTSITIHSRARGDLSWWFTLKPAEQSLSVAGLEGSFVKRISANFELHLLQFAACDLKPEHLEHLGSVTSLILSNIAAAPEDGADHDAHGLSRALRRMPRLQHLHFGVKGQVLDLADLVSADTELRALSFSFTNVTMSGRGRGSPLKLEKLVYLHINDVSFDDQILEHFGHIFGNVRTFIVGTSQEDDENDDDGASGSDPAVRAVESLARRRKGVVEYRSTDTGAYNYDCPQNHPNIKCSPARCDKNKHQRKWYAKYPDGKKEEICIQCIEGCDDKQGNRSMGTWDWMNVDSKKKDARIFQFGNDN